MQETTSYWPDIIGIIGTVLLITAYFLLQSGKISSTSLGYLSLNLIAALFMVYSLIWNFNLSAFIVQIFWIGISIYGIVRKYKKTEEII